MQIVLKSIYIDKGDGGKNMPASLTLPKQLKNESYIHIYYNDNILL